MGEILELKDVLIRRVDDSFLEMVNSTNKEQYMYNFAQYNAYLSVLFIAEMISFDEYLMMSDVKLSFYFSTDRNEVIFE